MKEKNNKNNQKPNDDAAEKAADSVKGPVEEKMGGEVTLSKAELDSLKAKAAERDEYYDKFFRAHAEFENVRKRMERDKAEFIKYANEGFMIEFLPIADNLEIAEKYIKEAKDFKAVRDGVDMIQAQIQRFLKDIGVERIKTVGEKFDPHLHEAIETVEAADKEEGIIVEELKPGYRFNDRLLRPASVKIVKKG